MRPGPGDGAGSTLMEPLHRRRMRAVAWERSPQVGLVEIGRPGVDIAADEVRVASLEASAADTTARPITEELRFSIRSPRIDTTRSA